MNVNIIFEATLVQFEAQKHEAIAELSTYFSGERGFKKSEIMNAVRKLAEAERCIKSLEKNFIETETDPILENE
jgi:hypothetical protein